MKMTGRVDRRNKRGPVPRRAAASGCAVRPCVHGAGEIDQPVVAQSKAWSLACSHDRACCGRWLMIERLLIAGVADGDT